MRILFLDDGVFEDGPGGNRLAARELASSLCNLGHEVVFLVPAHSSAAPSREDRGGLHIRRYLRPAKSPRLILSGYRAAAKLWSELHFDIIHAHFAFTSVGPVWALPRSLPCIRTFHGPWDREAISQTQRARRPPMSFILCLKAQIQRRIELLSLNQSDRIVVLSDHFSSLLVEQYGQSPDRIFTVPGGVDWTRFTPTNDKNAIRRELGLPCNRLLLLSVRRLVPRMGLHNLISAMPRVLRELPTSLLLIGGKGPEKGALEGLAHSLKLEEHVRFLDFIPESELPKFYQAADAFVLPSTELEGFGLVTLEALASGLPVIGTPTGATPEILGQLNPQLLTKGIGADALADAVISAFRTGLVDQLDAIGLAHWVRSRFSWAAHATKVEAIYRSTLEDRVNERHISPVRHGRNANSPLGETRH
jgi:glycosyltransferase involved in cell wall biosynthesis